MNRTNAAGIAIIKRYESLRLEAYLDLSDYWTIGWGSRRNVRQGMKITPDEAESRFLLDLAEAETSVSHLVRVPLTDNQFSALVSFTFNEGYDRLWTSHLLIALNSGDYAQAADEFLKWDKAHVRGVKIPVKGLLERRQEERELFLSGG